MSHGFVVGARVAVPSQDGYGENWIAKVHKNGNVTIQGSPQQYRPFSDGTATSTTRDRWSGGSRILLWNETTDALIQKRIADAKHLRRWHDIQDHVRSAKAANLKPEALDAIEAALGLTGRGQ